MGDDDADPPRTPTDVEGDEGADGREGDEGADDGTGRGDGEAGDGPTEGDAVSDGREKHVAVLLPDGETVEHGGVYLQHTASTFAVSDEPDFPDAETTRYEKSEVVRVEVKQHHSTCFVTTAVADERRTLDELRGFRDGTLARTAPGRGLVALYERVSPPIAARLARHPSAAPTRSVRGLVRLCAGLARRHRTAAGPARPALALVLVALYLVGVALGAAGAASLALVGGPPARRPPNR